MIWKTVISYFLKTGSIMKVERFLRRIDFSASVRPDLATLKALKTHFLHAVPFENLDIHYGSRWITLNVEDHYDKIVKRRRGGICFENNLLFAWALRECGFEAEIIGAQMMPSPGIEAFDETHLFLRVVLDGMAYAVDVGNGQSFRAPMRMDGSAQQLTPENMMFRIACFPKGPPGAMALYQRLANGDEEIARYGFIPATRTPSSFAHACQWIQTSPESNFVQGPIITLALPDGRMTATLKRLKIFRHGKMTEIPLCGEDEFLACLKVRFGIEPDGRRRFPAAGKGDAEPRT